MAKIVKTELEISIGDLGRSSKTKACIDIVTGNTYVFNHTEKLRDIIGRDPEEMKIYLTIPCKSVDSSHKFASFLKKFIEEVQSSQESIIGTFLQSYGMHEDVEESMPKIFEYEITAHNNNVIIKIGTYILENYLNFLTANFSRVFFFKNNLHVELDTRRSLHAILSPHFIHALTESALIKIILSYDRQALIAGKKLAKCYEMDENILKALGYASIYAGGSIKVNFKSADDLDERVKGALEKIVSMVSSVGQMIPPDISELASGLAENSGHEVFINVIASTFAGEISLFMRGASEIFQSN